MSERGRIDLNRGDKQVIDEEDQTSALLLTELIKHQKQEGVHYNSIV